MSNFVNNSFINNQFSIHYCLFCIEIDISVVIIITQTSQEPKNRPKSPCGFFGLITIPSHTSIYPLFIPITKIPEFHGLVVLSLFIIAYCGKIIIIFWKKMEWISYFRSKLELIFKLIREHLLHSLIVNIRKSYRWIFIKFHTNVEQYFSRSCVSFQPIPFIGLHTILFLSILFYPLIK